MFPTHLWTRRAMLKATGFGFGHLAFTGLLAADNPQAQNPLAAKQPHFAPRAKRVIMLTMAGGPSHVDTFDYKPALAKNAGKTVTATSGKVQDRGKALLPSPFKFEPHGQSGLPISELFPHLAKHADDLCLVNSMVTDAAPFHPQAFLQMHTGEFRLTHA